ncbi:unnamed protein product [Nippostrongylus brasiliensis]|uniref:Peroxiredoxin-6 (inferred by orthology to a human protein) n=1 Tax=Nippostrongylus brasiliensis TaxID=27835 RepID=A0A0N4YML6_NIPBR|nr:unnamed protein product [Nippostrongylus brasiliensis]
MKLGDTFPAFSAQTNLGKIDNFHEWMGNSYCLGPDLERLMVAFSRNVGIESISKSVFILIHTKASGEILRVIDSIQLSERMPVATPEGWKNVSDKCMVQPSVSTAKAEEILGKVDTIPLPSGKSYLRTAKLD